MRTWAWRRENVLQLGLEDWGIWGRLENLVFLVKRYPKRYVKRYPRVKISRLVQDRAL